MRKFLLLAGVLSITLSMNAQQNVPSIDITSNRVDINTGSSAKAYYNNQEIATKENVKNSITAVVAASNASAAEKSHADFVCDGYADEVEIHNAFNTFTKVILTGGDFYLSNSLYVWDSKSLCGAGMYVTKIHRQFNYIDGTTGQHIVGIGNNASLKDVTIDGEKATYNQGMHLLGIQVWRPDPTEINITIENILIKNVKGIPLQIWNAQNAIVSNITIIDFDLWVEFNGTSFNIDNLKVSGDMTFTISNSVLTSSYITTGIFYSQGNNNRIMASDINNLTLSGSKNVVVGNRIHTLTNNATNSVVTTNVMP
jgi:hypothetical protein